MSQGYITGSGTVTNYHLSTPSNILYTTVEEDEIIPFIDEIDGQLKFINDIQVFGDTTNIVYKLCIIENITNRIIKYSSDTMFVENGAIDGTTGVSYNAIQILGAIGQKFRFKANFY